MTEHTIRVVPNTSAESTKAIFDLHKIEDGIEAIHNEDVLSLQNADGVLRVVNKGGIELGVLPTGHPFHNAELLSSLRIETYKVIGRLDEPTLPRLHLTITRKENH